MLKSIILEIVDLMEALATMWVIGAFLFGMTMGVIQILGGRLLDSRRYETVKERQMKLEGKRVVVARWLIRLIVGVTVGAQAGTFLVWMLHPQSRALPRDVGLFTLYMVLTVALGVAAMLGVWWWAGKGEKDAGVQCEN